jgi:hypothetical protein
MEREKLIQKRIIEKFDSQFKGKLPEKDGIMLFQGDGFMDLVVRVLYESNGKTLISMGHYFEQEGVPYPDPVMHFRIDRKSEMVTPLMYFNGVHTTRSKNGLPLSKETKSDLLNFLGMWLGNIIMQGYSPVKDFPIWERQKQEKKGDYMFSGRTLMTHGFMGELSAFEVFSIMLDLHAFLLQKGKIDYLQVFNRKSDGLKVFVIDQLSEIMKSDGSYSEENLKEYDYHTYLLASEY